MGVDSTEDRKRGIERVMGENSLKRRRLMSEEQRNWSHNVTAETA